jgi:hypothetical protein
MQTDSVTEYPVEQGRIPCIEEGAGSENISFNNRLTSSLGRHSR